MDDDPNLLLLLKHSFAAAELTLYMATSGEEGLRLLYEVQPDLVLLDLLMPGLDGWQTLAAIRELTDIPVFILSALSNPDDIVQLLDSGATDYITKPFLSKVLVAKVKAALRQNLSSQPKSRVLYTDSYLTIELNKQQVYVRMRPVELTTTERKLLFYLFKRADQICTFKQILAHIWGWAYRDSTQYVHVYMSRLRQKIEQDPTHPRYLVTEHRIGYWFKQHNDDESLNS